MQHYLANDKMVTIHADRLIKGWEVKDAIAPSDVKPLFDYTIEKCPCFDNAGREIPSLFHIERRNPNSERGEILPIGGFGPNYTILQHSEMLDFVASIIPELPGTKIETAGTLENGATGIIQVSCGNFSLPGDLSKQESRLYFNNPIGGGSLVMGFCLTRCVCENTIAMARKEVIAGAQNGTGFSIRHTDKISVYAKLALASIVAQAKSTEAMKRRIAALARKAIKTDTIKQALAEIYPATPEMAEKSPMAYSLAISRRHEVIAQWEGGETAQTFTKDSAWKLVNAFTFPIFNPSKMTKGTDASGIRYDGLFGDRAEKVANIFATVERLAA